MYYYYYLVNWSISLFTLVHGNNGKWADIRIDNVQMHIYFSYLVISVR